MKRRAGGLGLIYLTVAEAMKQMKQMKQIIGSALLPKVRKAN